MAVCCPGAGAGAGRLIRFRLLSSREEIWYDPRYGNAHHIHTTDNAGYQTYTPPTTGRGNDWILILEDAAAVFRLPGAAQ